MWDRLTIQVRGASGARRGRAASWRRRALPLLAAALLLGCNVVQRQRAGYEADFRQASLAPRTARLGPDEVHYWEGGRGAPVLLVHGFGADAIWQWYRQVGVLTPRHRVVVPDLLWFGKSASRAATPRFSVAAQVEMLRALLDHLQFAAADLVGISYGGIVVYELARRYPARVRRLVLVDSPGREYTLADYRELCRRFGVQHIGPVLIPEDVAGVRRLLTLAYHDPPWMPDFAARQVLRDLYGDRRREKHELIKSLLSELGTAGGAAPVAPTLLLWGEGDPVFPVELGRRLARRLGARARLQLIARTRHAPNLERPEEVNRLLREFLDQ